MNTRFSTTSRIVILMALLLALALPSIVAAAPSCTTDCYVDPAGNDANDGASAATPLKSIQLAIDTAQPGGTVHLAAGTYFENAAAGWRELYITKSLSLVGAGSGATIIELPMKTNGLEILGANLTVRLEGLTFTKQAANATAADFNVRVAETASSNMTITFDDVESAYGKSQNVNLGSAGTYALITVRDSNFHHSGSWGFSIAGAAPNVAVTDSHFDNNGVIDPKQAIGLNLTAGVGVSNVAITGGTFNNNGVKTTNGSKGINMLKTTNAVISGIEAHGNFDGVIIWEWLGTSSGITIKDSNLSGNQRGITIGSETGMTVNDVTITGNNLSGNNNGVLIYRAAGWGEGAITDLSITRNDLSGSANGIAAIMPYETHDGTCNWWGDASGPGPVGPGTGSNVTSGVNFTPWLYVNDLDADTPCFVGGTIKVSKVTNPATDTTTEFEFDPSWSTINFTLKNGGSATSALLPAGSYAVAEVGPVSPWVLLGATCDNAATPAVEAVSPSSITLADGDKWECTFTNKYLPLCTTVCYADAVGGSDSNNGGTSPADAFKTIQKAINTVQAGGEVRVLAGTYPESPNINKSLTLKGVDGRDATIIQLQPQLIAATYLGALLIDADVVTVQGFTVEGFDADCADFAVDGDQDDAATNVMVTSTPDTVVIKDNRFKVGAKNPACTTYDDAIGVANYYNETVDVASLTVENNLFQPLNASASRAFYINPGANQFVFRGNTITGQFTAASYTQAKDGLVENNTVAGTGTSRGLGTWGYPDPTVYGKTLFRNNTISNVVNGITIYGSENVTVTKNVFTGNDRAVFVDKDVAYDLSTIHINRNSIAGNDLGVENWYTTDVDATCNWWGAASGPGPVGPGTGDNVTAGVAFAPWLKTADLDGLCFKANVFVSANTSGVTSDGVAFGGEDILMWNGSVWSLWFDGSAAGLAPVGKWKHNLNAIYIPQQTGPTGPLTAAESDGLIVSFTQNARTVPGITGKVDGMDLVKWDGTAWSLWFDGSDVGLTAKTPEKIDALHVLPGAMSPIGANCQAYLLISTQGPGSVPNPAGGKPLKFGGEDLLGFCMTNWGATTTGLWHIVLDGSAQGMPKNSLDSLSASVDGMTYYLTTRANFNVDGAGGGHSQVYVYDVATQTFSGPVFSAPAAGLGKKVDALHVELLP